MMGQKPLRERELEVRHGHLARQEEGDRPREQPEEEQPAPERLEDPGQPGLGQQRRGATVRRHAHGEGEELHRAGLDEH